MDEGENAAIEAALDQAFGGAPAPAPAAKPAPVAKVAPAPVQAPEPAIAEDAEDEGTALERAADELDVDALPAVEEPAEDEPEFVIEVAGKTEVVRGKEQVKELLQKGADYSAKSAEVARTREVVMAQAQMQQMAMKFNQEFLGDISEMRALDNQLAEFNKVDMAALIDSDFMTAMKLQQQRAALKEARDAKLNVLNQKKSAFEQGQAEAAKALEQAEERALLAKLPGWANSERAATEKQAIIRTMSTYGYQPGEIAQLMDHRLVVAFRDLAKYQALKQNTTEKVKQVREAPPVVKPGAAATQQDPNSKAGFDKFTREFRKQGRAGNHRAQEASLEKVLARTFK